MMWHYAAQKFVCFSTLLHQRSALMEINTDCFITWCCCLSEHSLRVNLVFTISTIYPDKDHCVSNLVCLTQAAKKNLLHDVPMTRAVL